MTDDRPKLREETLDFLFEYTRDAPARQFSVVDGLDAKIVQVFAAATVIVGLAAVNLAHQPFAVTIFLAVAILAYIGVVVATVRAVGVTDYKGNAHADALWHKFWADDVMSIKHALVASTSKAYAENRELIAKKGSAVQCAIIATGIEAIAVGISLLVAAVS